MSGLSKEEKAIVGEALQVYLQIAAQQMPQQHMQKLAKTSENILKKLDNLKSVSGGKGNKPAVITDEWYKKVCLKCDKLTEDGCTDKVTEKYPGKCDPILHYENRKRGIER